MKRLLFSLVFVLSVLVSVSFAFGWSLEEAAKPYSGTTIRFITETTPPSYWIEEVLPEFEQATGIKVIVERQAHPHLEEKALMDFAAGTGIYDVFNFDYSWTGKYVKAGYIVPLEPFMNSELADPSNDLSDFYPRMWEGTMWEGKVYGYPFDSVIEYLFWNKKIFDDYGVPGPPKTPDEWMDAMQKLNHPPKLYGTGMQAKRHLSIVCEWLNLLWAFDGALWDDSYNVTLNNANGIKATEFYKKMADYAPPGVTTWTWDDVNTALQQGRVAQAIQWDENYGSMEDPEESLVVGQMRYAPVPTARADGKPVSHYGGSSLGIPTSSKNKEAAFLFIQWATSYDIQLRGVGKGSSPTRRSIYQIPELREKYPSFVATDAAAETTFWRPRIPEWDGMVEVLALELNSVIAGAKDVKEALDASAAEIDKILQEGGYK
jgi:multiple sugar transport system substrate-binding protein